MPMNIQEAYDDWSATYDTDLNLTRDLDRDSTAQVLGDLRFNAILEIGCGTGKNTRLFSQIGRNVLALDFSAGMIHKAQEKVGSTNVSYCVTDLRSLWPCKAGSFELVSCNLVLEHIEDLSPVFSEAYRVLKNGGHFYISELHPFRQYQGKKARFDRGAQTVEVDAFVHHLSEFFNAAGESSFRLNQFQELWHAEDGQKMPRLVSLMFLK